MMEFPIVTPIKSKEIPGASQSFKSSSDGLSVFESLLKGEGSEFIKSRFESFSNGERELKVRPYLLKEQSEPGLYAPMSAFRMVSPILNPVSSEDGETLKQINDTINMVVAILEGRASNEANAVGEGNVKAGEEILAGKEILAGENIQGERKASNAGAIPNEVKTSDKDINDLLSKLDSLLAKLKTPLEANESGAAKEILARMPQLQGLLNDKGLMKAAANELPILQSMLCPLENENDQKLFTDQLKNIDVPAAQKEVKTTEAAARGAGENVKEEASSKTAPPKAGEAKSANAVHQPFDISPEKAAAAEQMKAMPTVKTVATQNNLFDTMVDKITSQKTADASMLEIQLKPDFLGKVSIQLSFGDGGLHAKILAEDAGVRSMINGQITSLIETLSDKGIKVSALEVINSAASDHGFNQSKGQAQQEETHKTGLKAEKIELGDIASVMNASSEGIEAEIDMGESTVSYRA